MVEALPNQPTTTTPGNPKKEPFRSKGRRHGEEEGFGGREGGKGRGVGGGEGVRASGGTQGPRTQVSWEGIGGRGGEAANHLLPRGFRPNKPLGPKEGAVNQTLFVPTAPDKKKKTK